jgi:xylulokinase
MSVYLGIDIGTSGTKTLAVREDGAILGSATETYDLFSPQPGWSEQSPEDWWNATVKSVQRVLWEGQIKGEEVRGIGLSGQMHGSVFLDRTYDVVRPAILWNDQRTKAECDDIEDAVGGRRKLIGLVANPALTGFTAPKILWLRKNEKRNFDRVIRVLLPKDYIRFRLTGEFATEVSDASGTLLLDVKKRQWCQPLLQKLKLDPALLPPVFESEEVSGKVTRAVAEQLAIPEGTPVVGGGGDQAASALGNGIVKRGVISATMGTSGVVFAHSDTVQIDPRGRVHTFCHAVRGKWHVMGCVLSAGGSLQWYRDQLAAAEVDEARRHGIDPYEILTAQAAGAPVGSEGLFFLPYLTGERTPHADPYARGAWVGLTRRHEKAHLVRAIIEGATYAMRDSLEIIKGMDIPVKEIRLSGGGARSQFWRQVQADVYGQKVTVTNASEGPAYGVALLAAAGTGAYKDVVEACTKTIQPAEWTATDPKAKRTYNKAFAIYGQLYRSLKGDFADIAALVGHR